MTETNRPRVLFVTTYDPIDESLGGASWVDRQLLAQLSEVCDVDVMTVASPGSPTDVPLEVRRNRRHATNTLWRMARYGETYQEAKFKWHQNWASKVAELQHEVHAADVVVTSQWPSLLLCDDAGIRPDIHVAHNVDWVLAERFDPLPFRLASNAKKMKHRERALLGLPNAILALSTSDVKRLANTGVFSQHIPLVPSGTFSGDKSRRTVGFIGKISWPPNRAAVDRLLDDVLPHVNSRLQEPVTVVLAGAGTEQFTGRKDVRVLGRVEDVRSFYDEIDIAAIPRGGEVTGISVKLIEAMEYGKIAVAPRRLKEDAGICGSSVLEADTVSEMSDAIVDWYSEPRLSETESILEASIISPLIPAISLTLLTRPRRLLHSIPEARAVAADRCVSSVDQLVDLALRNAGPVRVQTVNLHHAYLARTLPDFRDAISTADVITADGWPILEQFRVLHGKTDLARVTGSEFLSRLVEDDRLQGKRVGLIGGTMKAAAGLDVLLRKKGGKLTYRETGSKQEWVPQEIADCLTRSECDIVLLAVTPPYGDLLAAELQRLGAPGFKISIGGGLEMLVGERRRAPKLVQMMRMEWLYRLAQDPRHLWERYMVQCVPTYISMLQERVRQT